MHPMRTIAKQALSNVKFNASKTKHYKDHRVALKEGNEIAATIATPGFKLVIQDIANDISQITEQWMDVQDPLKREELRVRALTYKEILQKFDKYLMKRDNARKAIRQKKDGLGPQE